MAEATKRITIDPKVMGGEPVIKDTRIPVYFTLELLSNRWSIEDTIREYPRLTKEDVLAAIEYATEN